MTMPRVHTAADSELRLRYANSRFVLFRTPWLRMCFNAAALLCACLSQLADAMLTTAKYPPFVAVFSSQTLLVDFQ